MYSCKFVDNKYLYTIYYLYDQKVRGGDKIPKYSQSPKNVNLFLIILYYTASMKLVLSGLSLIQRKNSVDFRL